MGIFFALAFLAAAQAFIGIEMVNTPPTKNWHKWGWRVSFAVIALAMLVLGYFQFKENDEQQRDFDNRIYAIQVELTNSIDENLELRREMKQQFDQLTEDFSTNSSIAVEIRVGLLTNELNKAIAEGNELQKSHQLFDISPVDIDAVRAKREHDLALKENQAKQEKLQEELDAIKAKRDAAKQAVEDAEQERQAEKDFLDKERVLSAPAVPVFDYTIRKLCEILRGVSKGSGWTVTADFPGQNPAIYASTLLSNGIVVNGTNFIALGGSSAWDFAISTSVTPPSPRRWPPFSDVVREFAVLTIQAAGTNGDSILTVTPEFEYRFSSRYNQADFMRNNIQGDYWFNNVRIALNVPDGLNMDEGCEYDGFTNDIDEALNRLVGAQDQQCKIPTH